MPSKRKVIKKMKRAINRAKARGQLKQNNNKNKVHDNNDKSKVQQPQGEMLLKLIAMMNGAKGGGSMDPGAFLAASEKRAKDDAEHKKIMKEKKLEIIKAKDEERKAKNELEERQADAEVEQARDEARHKGKILEKKLEKVSREGELSKLNRRNEELELEILQKKEDISVAELQHKIKLSQMQNDKLKQDPEFKNVSPETKKHFKLAVDKIADLLTKLEDFQKNLSVLDDEQSQLNELEKIATEYVNLEKSLIEARQRTEFELDQVKQRTTSKQEIVKSYNTKKKEYEDVQYHLANALEQEKYADLIYETDENGNIIKDTREDEKRPVIDPLKDKDVLKQEFIITDIKNHLKSYKNSRGTKVNWDTVLRMDPDNIKDDEKSMWQDAIRLFDAREGINRPKIRGVSDGSGRYELPSLIKIYHKAQKDYSTAYEIAQEKREEAIKHNEKIDLLPKTKSIHVTKDMVAALDQGIAKTRSQIEQSHLRSMLGEDLVKKKIKLTHEKELLEAELKQIPDVDQVKITELTNEIAKIDQEIKDIQHKQDVKNTKQNKIYELEKQTSVLDVDNKLQASKLNNMKSDKVLEDEEKSAVEAQMKAQKQKELNEVKEITYKYEREARMAKHRENAMKSEEIKASDDEIARQMANHQVYEIKKRQDNELKQLEEQLRDDQINAKATEYLNDMMQGHVKVDDMIGQIKDMRSKLSKVTDQALTDRAYIRENADKLYSRLNQDPMLQLAMVRDYENIGRNTSNLGRFFNDRAYFESQILNRQDVDDMSTYFDKLQRTPPPRARTPPSTPRKEFKFYGPDRVVETRLFDDTSDEE